MAAEIWGEGVSPLGARQSREGHGREERRVAHEEGSRGWRLEEPSGRGLVQHESPTPPPLPCIAQNEGEDARSVGDEEGAKADAEETGE